MAAIDPKKNWTALYADGIAPEIEIEAPDMLTAFKTTHKRDPLAAALHFFDETIPFATLDEKSDALACWLADNNVKPGDRVSIITQNLPAFPVMALATWKVGAIPVPGNPAYKYKELAKILQDAEPAAIMCESDVEAELQKALPLAKLESTPLAVCLSDHDGAQPALAQDNSVENLIKVYTGKTPKPHTFDPEDTGLILYTSGTTGVPKGTMLSHKTLVFNAQFMRDWCGLHTESRIFAQAPLFHIIGFECHICASFFVGCSNVINYRFTPQLGVDMIRKWKPTFAIATITAFNALSSVPGLTKDDMSCFEQVYSGGAPVPPALKEKLEAQLGLKIHPCYGMTETAAPAVFTPYNTSGPEIDGQLSIGVPIPSTDLIIAGEGNKELPRGEVGEVLMRGPHIMQAYWRKEESSSETLANGWLHSGDVGIMDEQGWVYLVDRKKDMIIASGFKVWPREVEDVLYGHPAVREAAVIGVADEYRGENVKACISLREGTTTTEKEIIDFCRENLAGYKVPRTVEIFDDLPKTVSGKIQRVALRET